MLAGLVVAGLLALLLFTSLGDGGAGGSDPDGTATGGGDRVTFAQFRSVKLGAGKGAVERRFGGPTTSRNPFQDGARDGLPDEDCIGYESAGRAGGVAHFCFRDDRLTSKYVLLDE